MTLTAAEAVRRAQFISAMKGNVRAQRSYLELLARAEREKREEREAVLLAVGEYKLKWAEEFERRRRAGVQGKAPLIDPDAHVIDPVTGDLRFREAATDQEKARWTKYRTCENYLRELATQQDKPNRRGRTAAPIAKLEVLLNTLTAALNGSREAMLTIERVDADLARAFPDEDESQSGTQ